MPSTTSPKRLLTAQSTTFTAGSDIADNPYLVSLILPHLDMSTLLASALRVSKEWNYIISTSQVIQKKLFLVPDHRTRRLACAICPVPSKYNYRYTCACSDIEKVQPTPFPPAPTNQDTTCQPSLSTNPSTTVSPISDPSNNSSGNPSGNPSNNSYANPSIISSSDPSADSALDHPNDPETAHLLHPLLTPNLFRQSFSATLTTSQTKSLLTLLSSTSSNWKDMQIAQTPLHRVTVTLGSPSRGPRFHISTSHPAGITLGVLAERVKQRSGSLRLVTERELGRGSREFMRIEAKKGKGEKGPLLLGAQYAGVQPEEGGREVVYAVRRRPESKGDQGMAMFDYVA
ncbi:Hypothetical protein D9617_18g033050 [Elsinoe fawcettii]|nr:Hypothetical protein D9617_18g033050 [Elsinoe fawcettii]